MKRLFFLGMATVLAFSLISCGGESQPSATTPASDGEQAEVSNKDFSRALGNNFGYSFQVQGLEFDMEEFIAGLKEVVDGGKKFDEEDLQAMQTLIQTYLIQQEQRDLEVKRQQNVVSLDSIAKLPGIQADSSGLYYSIIEEGNGARPADSSFVECHYVGELLNGEVFDSSEAHGGTAVFQLFGVIRGWTIGIPMIKEGGSMVLYIPPELAYGEQGRRGMPALSILKFKVDLVHVLTEEEVALHKKGEYQNHGQAETASEGEK